MNLGVSTNYQATSTSANTNDLGPPWLNGHVAFTKWDVYPNRCTYHTHNHTRTHKSYTHLFMGWFRSNSWPAKPQHIASSLEGNETKSFYVHASIYSLNPFSQHYMILHVEVHIYINVCACVFACRVYWSIVILHAGLAGAFSADAAKRSLPYNMMLGVGWTINAVAAELHQWWPQPCRGEHVMLRQTSVLAGCWQLASSINISSHELTDPNPGDHGWPDLDPTTGGKKATCWEIPAETTWNSLFTHC